MNLALYGIVLSTVAGLSTALGALPFFFFRKRTDERVIDALLGAAGLGDIGRHYPDTDPAYAGASSIALLSHTADMLRAAGYRVCSLDTVVIAEQPKIGPFAAQMRESLANAMKVSPGCVNIKGKTTEGLGPTGTGEAIAALAVAMVVDMRSGAAI